MKELERTRGIRVFNEHGALRVFQQVVAIVGVEQFYTVKHMLRGIGGGRVVFELFRKL